MSDEQLSMLEYMLPTNLAQEELLIRKRNAPLSDKRIHDLIWLATDNKELAEETAAWHSLEQNYQKITHQSTKSQ